MSILPPNPQPSTALLITRKNCESVLGLDWRFTRRRAAALGIPVIDLGGRKLAIEAAPLLAALSRTSTVVTSKPLEELDDDAQRAAMLAELGLQAGGHR